MQQLIVVYDEDISAKGERFNAFDLLSIKDSSCLRLFWDKLAFSSLKGMSRDSSICVSNVQTVHTFIHSVDFVWDLFYAT